MWFGVDPEELLKELVQFYPGSEPAQRAGQRAHALRYSFLERQGIVAVPDPKAQLPVGTLQNFLDDYLVKHPGARIDYIHGEDVAVDLAKREDAIAFLLPAMGKDQLFPTVIHDGVLPRKTFSMGEAHDKRFYLEARKIRL